MTTFHRRPGGSFALLLLVSACSVVQEDGGEFGDRGGPRVLAPDELAVRAIDEREIARHVARLSSASTRRSNAPGVERAAAWIADRFREAGLQPGGDDGGYIQFWPFPPADATTDDDPIPMPNVVGLLPGSDLSRAGEYIILIARFHQLTDRSRTSPVDPVDAAPDRAGDEARAGDAARAAATDVAGIAALVEIARAFGQLRGALPRPVLFLAVSDGHMRALGSRWYAGNPTVFLSGAVAVLSVHAGGGPADSVAISGHSFSSLGPLVDRMGARDVVGLGIAAEVPEERFRRGDHYPFARLGVPAIGIGTGLGDDDRASADEAGTLDAAKVARVARLVLLTVHELATAEASPEWTEAGRRAMETAP